MVSANYGIDVVMNSISRRNLKSGAILWIPLVVWMTVIFIGSSLSADAVNQAIHPHHYPLSLVIGHIGEFAILSVLCHRFIRAYKFLPTHWTWFAVLTINLFYGAVDELHQMFVPGRVPSIVDLGYDSLGAVIGLVVYETKIRIVNSAKQ